MRTLRPLSLLGATTLVAAGLFGLPLMTSATATPTPGGGVAAAQDATTALANAVVAAVVSISDATPPGSTPDEIEAGSRAVSMLVPDHQMAIRLIDATNDPLDKRNAARGSFETQSLMQLIGGAPVVQTVVGNDLRTLVPLTNTMHPSCVTCHTNYGALPADTVVGAASFAVGL